jgi:peptidoglycan hydrolase-like protein with peptidoglycan-binding domain
MHHLQKVIALTALVALFSAAPAHAAALTEPQIQAILGVLSSFNVSQAVLANVEVALRGGTPSGVGAPAAPADPKCAFASGITLSLAEGSSDTVAGGQVSLVQKFLALDKTIYPEGSVTGYFGPMTVRAVGRFQAKNGIIPSPASSSAQGYGIVGAKTRSAFMQGCPASSGTGTTTPPEGTGSSVVVGGLPPTVSMHFKGAFVQPGQAAVLVWTSINATRCTLDDGTTKKDVPPNGSTEVYPSGISSYKMSCTNDADPYNIRIFTQTLTASSTAPTAP